MGAALSLLEDVVLYMVETFTAGVVQSCQGQEQHSASLLHDQDPLEDFRKFNGNDEIFQEYDPPPGDNSKMGWKRSRPPTWRVSLLEGHEVRILHADSWRRCVGVTRYFNTDFKFENVRLLLQCAGN